MTTRYLRSTIENGEAWHKSAKEDYFIRNNIPTKIIRNYVDRFTGTTEDTVVGLSVTGTIHTDRIYNPVFHPNYPVTNLVYYEYDDTDVENDKSFAYSTTQAWRSANVSNVFIIDRNKKQLEAIGFTFEEEE